MLALKYCRIPQEKDDDDVSRLSSLCDALSEHLFLA